MARWFLLLKVWMWRFLMSIGMKRHHSIEPKSPRPNFEIIIPSRLSEKAGQLKLVFYVPQGYFAAREGYRYPLVINFHGGGFVLGTATDDARWASHVVKNVDAVFVSVEYRLAPKYPFSVGLDDGSDAVIYLASHAKELRLDSNRIVLSGFSAGGNLALAIPFVLLDLKNDVGKRYIRGSSNSKQNLNYTPPTQPINFLSSSTKTVYKFSDLEPTELETHQKFPDLTLQCIVSFYPPIDFRQSRAEKRTTNRKPEKNLPVFLVNLFDESYFYPRDKVDVTDPYVSPAAATDMLLKNAYPDDIVFYTCEFDMLNLEGIVFRERLSSAQVGKTVYGEMINEVAHAFDKMPDVKGSFETAYKCYSEACAELKKIFSRTIETVLTQDDKGDNAN